MFPSVFGVNPDTGLYEGGMPWSVAESWEYNEDGTVLTVTLVDGLTWSDGEPITVDDVFYSWDAIRSNEIESPRIDTFATLADGTESGGPVRRLSQDR